MVEISNTQTLSSLLLCKVVFVTSCLVWSQSFEKVKKRLFSLLGPGGCFLLISQKRSKEPVLYINQIVG